MLQHPIPSADAFSDLYRGGPRGGLHLPHEHHEPTLPPPLVCQPRPTQPPDLHKRSPVTQKHRKWRESGSGVDWQSMRHLEGCASRRRRSCGRWIGCPPRCRTLDDRERCPCKGGGQAFARTEVSHRPRAGVVLAAPVAFCLRLSRSEERLGGEEKGHPGSAWAGIPMADDAHPLCFGSQIPQEPRPPSA